MVVPGNPLICLVPARNTLQHENGQKNEAETGKKPLILLAYLMAIPAGFEPATHGVEIRYWNMADYSWVAQRDANQNREFVSVSVMRLAGRSI